VEAKYKDLKKIVEHGPGPLELQALVLLNHWSYAPACDVWEEKLNFLTGGVRNIRFV
jgi:hypothetical protein